TQPPADSRAAPAGTILAPLAPTSASTSPSVATRRTRSFTPRPSTSCSTPSGAAATGSPNSRRASSPDAPRPTLPPRRGGRGGATGLTFYDGLVPRYFHTDAAPMLATAVGIPNTTPAPSGAPGQPAELRGYGAVMGRLAATLRRS